MEAEQEFIEVRTTKHGVVELRKDSILVFRPDVATFKEYNFEILGELLEVFIEMTDGVPRPYMCDNRYITGIIGKAEQAYIEQNFPKFATRAAMISNSNLLSIMVNSYNVFFKPKVPLKLFSNEQDAVKWLLTKR